MRESTRDIDGLILAPEDHDALKEMIAIVGQEMNLRANWLNDDVRIFVTKISEGPVLLDAPGITVQRAATEQLLAMKLAASRDMQDDRDAMALLEQLILVQPRLSKTEAWQQIEPFVPFQPGLKLRARELLGHFWQQRERDDSNQDPDT